MFALAAAVELLEELASTGRLSVDGLRNVGSTTPDETIQIQRNALVMNLSSFRKNLHWLSKSWNLIS